MRNAGGALPARHILGNYELFEEIGRGGMGIVYRALDLSLDRVVAVKILRDDLRAHQSIVTRFSREAQAAARLDHGNIVQIYSVGAVDRTPYIAMEYIDALPLSAVMQREHRLEWKPALEIARQIAAALACAHESHVIHRDIKPPNILLDDQHHAFVTDFGIAKILTLDDNLTVDGTRLGTPHYMAPERCKTGEVTASSDLYSLGVLLFQMLTGRLPYEASTPVDMIQRITSEPPARVRRYVADIPEDVERLVAWLMEMNPKHRPANGGLVCEAIDRVLDGRPLDASEQSAPEAIADFRKSLAKAERAAADSQSSVEKKGKHRRVIVAAAIAAVLVAVVAAFALRSTPTPALSAIDTDPAAWMVSPSVAEFTEEGGGVRMARLNLDNYTIESTAFVGNDGAVVALLRQNGSGERHVLCTVNAAMKSAQLRYVSGDRSEVRLLAAGQTASLAGYGFVMENGAFSALPFAGTVVDMPAVSASHGAAGLHPSAPRWAASRDDAEASALSEFGIENGAVVERVLLPKAAGKITDIDYSPDGQRVVYLRETGIGTQSLHLLPITGALEEPVAFVEGHITLGEPAFNPDGSEILIADARDSRTSSVYVLSTVDGQVRADIGSAARGAWVPATDGIVIAASDRKGALQLWSVAARAGAVRTQLTFVDGGVSPAVSVSHDGRWAVAPAADTEQPSLVAVQLAN